MTEKFNFAESMAGVQRKGGRGSGFKPALNLPVRIHQVVLADPNGKMTRGKDYIEAYLRAPAFGKEENTIVKVVLKDRGAPQNSEKVPLEFHDLQIGKKVKGRYKVGEYATLVLEDARELNDGTIECGWVTVAEYAFDQHPTKKENKELLQVGWVSTGYLNIPEPGSESYPFQNRSEHRVHEASVISGRGEQAIANFRELAIAALTPRLDEGSAGPGFMIRLVNNEAFVSGEGLLDAVKTVNVRARWDKEAKAFASAEATVDAFLAAEENATFVAWINHADDIAEGKGTLEIWPVFNYQAGKMAVENEVKAKNAGRRYASEDFSAPGVLLDGSADVRENGSRRNQFGLIAEGMHKLVLIDGKSDWTADKTFTLERYPTKLYTAEELPSRNLPEHTVKYLSELAGQRVEDKKAARDAKSSAQAEQPAQQQEQAQDFGDEQTPDPTAGNTPAQSSFRPR